MTTEQLLFTVSNMFKSSLKKQFQVKKTPSGRKIFKQNNSKEKLPLSRAWFIRGNVLAKGQLGKGRKVEGDGTKKGKHIHPGSTT